jgi:D-alanyl-D-alanine carboxypeptidase
MKLRGIFFVFVILSLVLTAADANAARGNAKYASLVVDADSGTILHNEYGEGIRHPASLTKLMTLYLSFEALKNHKMNLNETVWVSRHAASQPRMSLALKTGDKITVKKPYR